jgi:hypothetical protein
VKRSRKGQIFVFVVLLAGSAALAYSFFDASREGDRFCSREEGSGRCLQYMTLPASFDALPKRVQEILREWSETSPDGYTFDQKGQAFTIAKTAFEKYGAYFRMWSILQDQHDMTRLENLLGAAKPGSKQKAACDLRDPSRLIGMNETNVRRCLRAFYLSFYAPEFNERTRKLFNDVKIRYADGTTGPVSFVRPNLTDADLAKMMSAMERFDARARSLGGFR